MDTKMNLNTNEKYIPIIENAEEELRAVCKKRAVRLYGEIPEIVSERIEWEINSLKASKDLVLMLIFGRVLQSDEIKPYMIRAKGNLSSSIISYLLNITKANPLPPHYRCMCGNYYDFDTEKYNVSIGADLPSKLCPVCGKKLMKDGFNLHSELLFGKNGGKGLNIELNVPKGKNNKIIDIIECMPEIQPVTDFPTNWITDEMREHFNRFFRIIIPEYVDLNDVYTSAENCNYDIKTYLNKAYPFYQFDIYDDESLDLLTAMGEMNETNVDEIEFEGTNILHIFSDIAENENILNKKIRDIISECNPLTVSNCIKTEALSYNHLWQNIGKKIIESGKAKLNDLPSTIEDVYETLLNMGLSKALSFDITQSVYMGKGLTDKQEKLLLEHGASDCFIEFCNNVRWLFPRAHIAEGFIVKSRLEYFRCNYSERFDSIAGFKNKFDGINGCIPTGIKTLSSFFFSKCITLQNATVPDSVVVIDDFAFLGCRELSGLEIPPSVKKIGKMAFSCCNDLKNLKIPGSVTKIGFSAFECCDNLEKVTIENGLNKISDSAFVFCKKLSEVIIPDSVEEIGESSFAACESLEKLIIPKSVVKIGEYAFDLLNDEPKVTLYCKQGSYAEQYAKENNISYEYI